MELVAVYLYNRIPIEVHNVSNKTFHNLKRNGWYSDVKNNQKFTMLNKRIEVEGKWYRSLIRFEYQGINSDGNEFFNLSLPTPFVITQCEPVESLTSGRWKDNKTYHGPKLGSVSGFLEAGVPSSLIDEVYRDLQEHIIYV